MNLFQVITVPIVILLFIRNLVLIIQGHQPRRPLWIGLMIWLAAGIAIIRPDWTIQIATALGIGRGADLVLYLLAFAFILSVFYFYNRLRKNEVIITEIVRQIAIQNAEDHRSEGGLNGQTKSLSSTDAFDQVKEIEN